MLTLGNLNQIDSELKKFEKDLNEELERLAKYRPPEFPKYDDSYLLSKLERVEIQLTELKEELLKLKIVYPDDTSVKFAGGGEVEAELIDLITKAICPGKFSILTKNRAQEKIKSALFDFKNKVSVL